MKEKFKIYGKVSPTADGVHNPEEPYQKLSIVFDGFESGYISKRFVPRGISLDNDEYWMKLAQFSDELKELLEELRDRLEIVENASEFLTERFNNLEAQFQELNILVQNLNTRITEVENSFSIIEQLVYQLQQEFIEFKESVETIINNLSDRITAEVETLNARIDQEVSDLNTRITNEVSTLNSRIDQEVATLNALIESVRTELLAYIKQVEDELNAKIDSLEARVIILEAKVIELDDKIDTQVAALKSEINTARQECINLINETETSILQKLADEYLTKAEINATFALYYTKTEIDAKVTIINDEIAALKLNIQTIENSVGSPNGIASLDSNGKVPSSQLPDEYANVYTADSISGFPSTGDTSTIYIADDTGKIYRWSGTQYVEITTGLVLGETSTTAYAGDKGKDVNDRLTVVESNYINALTETVDSGNPGIVTGVKKVSNTLQVIYGSIDISDYVDLTGYVSLTGAQTITGAKTFTTNLYSTSNIITGNSKKTAYDGIAGSLLATSGNIHICSDGTPYLYFYPNNATANQSYISASDIGIRLNARAGIGGDPSSSYILNVNGSCRVGTNLYTEGIVYGSGNIFSNGRTSDVDGVSGTMLSANYIITDPGTNSYSFLVHRSAGNNMGYLRTQKDITGFFVWNRLAINTELDENYILKVGGSVYMTSTINIASNAYAKELYTGSKTSISDGNAGCIISSTGRAYLDGTTSTNPGILFYVASTGVGTLSASSSGLNWNGKMTATSFNGVALSTSSGSSVFLAGDGTYKSISVNTDDCVKITGAQTVAGVKTFTSLAYLSGGAIVGSGTVNGGTTAGVQISTAGNIYMASSSTPYIYMYGSLSGSASVYFKANTAGIAAYSRFSVNTDTSAYYNFYVNGTSYFTGSVVTASLLEAGSYVKSGTYLQAGSYVSSTSYVSTNNRTTYDDGLAGVFLAQNGRLFLGGTDVNLPYICFGDSTSYNNKGTLSVGTNGFKFDKNVGINSDAVSYAKLYVDGTIRTTNSVNERLTFDLEYSGGATVVSFSDDIKRIKLYRNVEQTNGQSIGYVNANTPNGTYIVWCVNASTTSYYDFVVVSTASHTVKNITLGTLQNGTSTKTTINVVDDQVFVKREYYN